MYLLRKHSHPCLEYHIHRCLGPCVDGLTTNETYGQAVRDVRMFLVGRHRDLTSELHRRIEAASDAMRYEEAAGLVELLKTVQEMGEKQKMASTDRDDTDILAYYAEPPLVAVNLFHLRGGHIVDQLCLEAAGKTHAVLMEAPPPEAVETPRIRLLLEEAQPVGE